jgi:hypothetical protein
MAAVLLKKLFLDKRQEEKDLWQLGKDEFV